MSLISFILSTTHEEAEAQLSHRSGQSQDVNLDPANPWHFPTMWH